MAGLSDLGRRRFLAGGAAASLFARLGTTSTGAAFAAPGTFPDPAASWLGKHPDVPVIGSNARDVVIVEFLDYRCTFCRAMQPALERLLVENSGLTIAVAEWPIYGRLSTFAARVALAAHRQGLFRPVHAALLLGNASDQGAILATAMAAGMKTDPILDAGKESNRQLADIEAAATTLELKGTPALLLGDKVIRGALSYDDLRDLLHADRALPSRP